MMLFLLGVIMGAVFVWATTRRFRAYSNLMRENADGVVSKLIAFCERENIAIRPWDLEKPFKKE